MGFGDVLRRVRSAAKAAVADPGPVEVEEPAPAEPDERGVLRITVDYSLELVGQVHRKRAVWVACEEVLGRRAGDREKVSTVARLIPEPDNPADPNAIRVLIGEHHVGYVPRAATRPFHEVLGREGVRELEAPLSVYFKGTWIDLYLSA